MKNFGLYVFIILGIIVLLVVLDIPGKIPQKELTTEDSLAIAINDSIERAERDSIDAIIAYANRPWQIAEFNDAFGDPTGRKHIRTSVDGTFSNSATTNSYLNARIIMTKTNAGIFLHEYERSGPAQKFIGSGTIMIRNSNNETISISSSRSWNDSGGLLVTSSDFTKLRNILMKSAGDVRIVIRDEYSSVYNFTVDATGFTAEFNLL